MSLQPQPTPLDEALVVLKQLALNDQALLNPTFTQLMQLLCARKRSLATDDCSFDTCIFEKGNNLMKRLATVRTLNRLLTQMHTPNYIERVHYGH